MHCQTFVVFAGLAGTFTALGQTFSLWPVESDASPDRAEGDYACYRTFGDQDPALVTLNKVVAG